MKKNEIVMNDYAQLCRRADHLEPEMFDKYEVQRGLRDKNGNGVGYQMKTTRTEMTSDIKQ